MAVVAGDTVGCIPTEQFLARADATCRPQRGAGAGSDVPSPVIPHLYDRVAQWQMREYGVTREQLVSRWAAAAQKLPSSTAGGYAAGNVVILHA